MPDLVFTSGPGQPEGAPPMRKSCQFCRSRKIRCSGHRICSACKSRNVNCVYGRESSKGRPRASTTASATASVTNPTGPASNKPTKKLPFVSAPAVPFGDQTLHPLIQGRAGSISEELERVFKRKFLDRISEPLSPLSRLGFKTPPASLQASPTEPISYDKLFFGITHGLVQLVLIHYSSLGYCETPDIPTWYLARALTSDTAVDMFGDVDDHGNLPQFDEHHVHQMIELCFIHNPLSVILSKTLLLHDYRNGTHDEALLAVILADASHKLDSSLRKGEPSTCSRLLLWAINCLRCRSLDQVSLSTIQTLFFIGWHMICNSSPRRGYCYIELARVLTYQLHSRLAAQPASGTDCVNGVDVSKVELELIQRLYWLTFALELWAALQMNEPLCDKMPFQAPVGFPPLSTDVSFVLRLDRESGNVAAVRVQQRIAWQLWPLSHIASTIAPIYAMCFRASSLGRSDAGTGWESHVLTNLQRLLDGSGSFSHMCSDVRVILSEGLSRLRSEMYNHPSQILTFCAYSILVIHLIFPRADASGADIHISEAAIDDALQFMNMFKDSLCAAELAYTVEPHIMDAVEPHLAELLTLGIDTCSRVLETLFNKRAFGLPAEQEVIEHQMLALSDLSKALHGICKHPKLQTVMTIREVKKRLKGLHSGIERLQSASLQSGSQISLSELDWTSGAFLPTGDFGNCDFAGELDVNLQWSDVGMNDIQDDHHIPMSFS